MEKMKNTKQRQIIIDILNNSNIPLTANDVYLKTILKLPNIAKTTIYRNISSLLENKLITRYRLNKDEYSYKLNKNDLHQHYLICKKCGKLTTIKDCPIKKFEESLLKNTGFKMTGHSIEIFGYCKKCRE
jgi:Fe2+ or Zn2+ uptake regulation protein